MNRVLLCAALSLTLGACATHAPVFEGGWSFAAMGDTPYTDAEEVQLRPMIQTMNREPLAFVVHVGDIIDGAGNCNDERFDARRNLLQEFVHPFVLTPGDNDWTDCHRGAFDPMQRLERIRGLFHGGEQSLGQRSMPLLRQSAHDARYAEFRENVRWRAQGVVFVTLNIPGSNNNLGRTPEMDREHARRMAANFEWLDEAVAQAEAADALGLVIFMQANPGFDTNPRRRPGAPDGFLELRKVLAMHAGWLKKPILLVHGDTHRFRVDHPLRDPNTGKTLDNFKRLEVDGSPFVNWARVTVNPGSDKLFFIQRGREPL